MKENTDGEKFYGTFVYVLIFILLLQKKFKLLVEF